MADLSEQHLNGLRGRCRYDRARPLCARGCGVSMTSTAGVWVNVPAASLARGSDGFNGLYGRCRCDEWEPLETAEEVSQWLLQPTHRMPRKTQRLP